MLKDVLKLAVYLSLLSFLADSYGLGFDVLVSGCLCFGSGRIITFLVLLLCYPIFDSVYSGGMS